MAKLATVALPEFGGPTEKPELSDSEYLARLALAERKASEAGYAALVVYADREHSANMAYLTGVEPRFEEALLVLIPGKRRTLLVGNECLGYLPSEALKIEPVLYQDFSLMGQPRDKSRPVKALLAEAGIARGQKIGCAGWKFFDSERAGAPKTALEIPSYLADTLRELAASAELVENANAIFMDPQDGLRLDNSAAQIACFEYAAVQASESVLRALKALREGVTEIALEACFRTGGLPLSCHAMVSFGEKVKRGLSSPGNGKAQRGDTFAAALGVWGALNCRAGTIAKGPEDLSAELAAFYPKYASNYFDVVAAWYAAVRVGASAGEVFATVEGVRAKELYDFLVNPGHYIHLDEWVHAPFAKGSTIELRSGMALQMDIIPISKGPFCYTNAEDGIALADEALRKELAKFFPDCWARIEKRRAFMTGALGLKLDASVLPLGNMPGWLPPYALDLGKAWTAT